MIKKRMRSGVGLMVLDAPQTHPSFPMPADGSEPTSPTCALVIQAVGAAAAAGIVPGDVVLAVDGTATPSVKMYDYAVGRLDAYSRYVFRVAGAHGTRDVPLVMGARFGQVE